MDWWAVKQLRAQVVRDLERFVSDDFFHRDPSVELNSSLRGSRHYSEELNWGHKAARLGQELTFAPTRAMSPREVAASDLLMNLGLLASAAAAHGASRELHQAAIAANKADGNAGAVAKDLEFNQIPVLTDNVEKSLMQYLTHLSAAEKRPYRSLLPQSRRVPKINRTRAMNREDRLLLEDMFATAESHIGVNAARFRATHFESLDNLERMLSQGLIRQDGEMYLVGLAALPLLTSSIAKELVADANLLYQELRNQYVKELNAPVQLSQLSLRTKLPMERVRKAVRLMCEGPWWSGWGDLNSKDPHVAPGEGILRANSFPEALAGWRALRSGNRRAVVDPKSSTSTDWLTDVPQGAVREICTEIARAIDADLKALSAMGVRSVVDLIATELVGDVGGFEQKLRLLLEQQHISVLDHEILTAVVDVGHATVHRGHVPSEEVVNELFGVLTRLVSTHYGHSQLLAKLRQNTPKRRRKDSL